MAFASGRRIVRGLTPRKPPKSGGSRLAPRGPGGHPAVTPPTPQRGGGKVVSTGSARGAAPIVPQTSGLKRVKRINRNLKQNARTIKSLGGPADLSGFDRSAGYAVTGPRQGLSGALTPSQAKVQLNVRRASAAQERRTTRKEEAHTGFDVGPVHISPLDIGLLGVPGVGFGADVARVGAREALTVGAEKLAGKGGSKAVQAVRGVRAASKEAKAAKIEARGGGGLRNLPKRLRTAPKRTLTKVKRAPATARQTAEDLGTKAGRRRVATKAGGKAYSHPAASGVALTSTTPTGPGKKARAFIEGNVQAPLSDPGQYAATTYKAAQGFVTVPVGLAIEAGASVAQGSTKPIKGEIKKQVKGFKDFAATETSGDTAKIKKATLESYGATPLISGGLVGGAALRRTGIHPGEYLRKGVEEARKVRGKEHGTQPGTPHLFEKKRQRREESVGIAQHKLKGQLEIQQRGGPVRKAQEKAKGSEKLRTVTIPESSKSRIPIVKRLQKTHKDVGIHTGQLAGFLVRHGLDPSKPDHVLAQLRLKRTQMTADRRAMGIKTLELPQETLHTRDVMHYIERHPERLADPELHKAVALYRAQAKEARNTPGVEPQHSEASRFNSIAVTHKVPLISERVPHNLREKFAGSKSWGEALDRIKAIQGAHRSNHALAKKQVKIAESGLEQAKRTRDRLHEKAKFGIGSQASSRRGLLTKANPLSARRERELAIAENNFQAARRRVDEARANERNVRNEGKSLRQLRREAGAGVRRGTKTTPDQFAALEQELVHDANVKIREQGLRQPEYVYTGTARAPFEKGGGPNFQNMPGGGRQAKTGAAERLGLVHEGNLTGQSIGVPVARREMFAAARDMFARGGFSHKGREEMTAKEWAKTQQEGTVPRNVVLVPKQTYNRAYQILEPNKGYDIAKAAADQAGDLPDETWAHDLAQSLSADAQRTARADTTGTVYRAVQPERSKEFFAQLDKSRLSSGLLKANKATNFLILGTSPIWAALQFVAEGGQAAIQNPRILNPAWVAKSMKAYREMVPHERSSLEAIAGTTPRAIESVQDAQTSLASIEGDFADGYKGFGRTTQGRVIRAIPHSLREVDRWKGGRIRLLSAMGEIDRETKGLVNHFFYGMGKLDRQMRHDIEATKGMSDTHRYAYYATHADAAHRIQTGVDDMLGNWIALTRHERLAAPLSIFYPFLRMSLRWVFYGFPKHHPVIAATSAYLGMQNAIELKKLLHGDPTFFQYGQVPLHGIGKGGTSILNLSRIAPGQNTLLSMLGGTQQGPTGSQALQILQPAISTPIIAATGVSPLGGKQKAHSGTQALTNITGLSPIAREAQQVIQGGPVAAGKIPFLSGPGQQQAFDKLSQKLRPASSKNPLTPPLPEAVGLARDRVKFSQIIASLSANSSSAQHDVHIAAGNASVAGDKAQVRALANSIPKMQAKYTKATDQLNKLYKKYGIPYKAESAKFFEGYGQTGGGSGGTPNPLGLGTHSSGVGSSNPLGIGTHSAGVGSSNPLGIGR